MYWVEYMALREIFNNEWKLHEEDLMSNVFNLVFITN
jgi:hypothetical protein